MGGIMHPLNVVATVFSILLCIHGTLAAASPYLNPAQLDQGFSFIYDKPNQDLAIPVTTQCEQIRLKWSRDGNSTGPSPVAPYFLQVYSSASSVPYRVEAGFGLSFNWEVPFEPNTQYQICMFDTNGVSGGCQETYTMIANTTAGFTPSCQNATAPSALSVSATVPTGAMSQFSQIDQCTSLSVTPTSGTPPFTLTIAPDNHPPYNITSNSMSAISWLVSLPVGFRFFLSLESSDGLKWANGPLRVGGLGPTSCFIPNAVSQSFFDKMIIASSLVGVLVGIAVGILSLIFFRKWRRRRTKSPSQSYLAAQYASRNSPTKPLTAPSVIGSTIAPTVSTMPSAYNMPAMPLPSTPPSRSAELPLQPVRPVRHSVISRNTSVDTHTLARSETETVLSQTESQSVSTNYPLDVKRPIVTNQSSGDSVLSSDDSASLVSSSSNLVPVRPRNRPISVHSRAPTYVPRSASNLRGVVIQELDDSASELPPMYGQHVADPSLNYAPYVLSSGSRF